MEFKNFVMKTTRRDTEICIHLHGLINPAEENWRPRENMRSVIELLRYLCICGISPLQAYLQGIPGETNMHFFRENREQLGEMNFSEFPERMEQQQQRMNDLLSGLDDSDLVREVLMPWKESVPAGEAILNTTVKFLAAYRMQLFLYARLLGVEAGTTDNWRGRRPVPVKE